MCVCKCVSNEKVQKDVCQRYFTSLPCDVRFQRFLGGNPEEGGKRDIFFSLFLVVRVVFFLLCFWAEELF